MTYREIRPEAAEAETAGGRGKPEEERHGDGLLDGHSVRTVSIQQEEEEFERGIFEEENCIAVPFEATVTDQGELSLLVYSFCLDVAEEFAKRFMHTPFSEAAKAFLREKITPRMEKREYACETATDDVYDTYGVDGRSIGGFPLLAEVPLAEHPLVEHPPVEHLPVEHPPVEHPPVELLDHLTEADCRDSLVDLSDFVLDPKEPLDRMVVIRREGRIVSFAAANDLSAEDAVELTVETAKAYRRRGLGSSCVRAITEYFCSLGMNVRYVTKRRNLPSVRTAVHAGLRPLSATLSFVCYRREDGLEVACETDEDEEEEPEKAEETETINLQQ